ncbi:hypothetical protein HMPREF9123_2876 [Neisseria bacilliformis ATCC BAA-1200]|jgi:hypothetical protein|uniref:Uncharacterized protein n=1 Tax=Neisseria bacilliformis ATCC BAA-1200 TaxID=888742 RepID=F2BGL9_9NEIS|nr:hypothetical protein HMPREF9123_2876 [Neisseria bacilliformis ATCC BAA-1200]
MGGIVLGDGRLKGFQTAFAVFRLLLRPSENLCATQTSFTPFLKDILYIIKALKVPHASVLQE